MKTVEFRHGRSKLLLVTVLTVLLSFASIASGSTIGSPVSCGPNNSFCSYSISIDGQSAGSGFYSIGAGGELLFPGPLVAGSGGISARIDSISGNVDPILNGTFNATFDRAGFAVFGFDYILPIALSGSVVAHSGISYGLTTTNPGGASMSPIGAMVLTAQEVDFTPGGLGILNKGIDAGLAFSIAPGVPTGNSPIFTGVNIFPGSLAYDFMRVHVGFILTSNSQANGAFTVEQNVSSEIVPEISSVSLLAIGLGLIGWRAKRKGHWQFSQTQS